MIVHVFINPGDYKEKSSCSTIDCTNCENCDLYNRGECSFLAPFTPQRCKYGKFRSETGYTKRASKYYSWLSEHKSKYVNTGRLSWYSVKMAIVGDQIFLPYAHMTMNEAIPFDSHGGTFFSSGNSFLALKDLTVDTIISICNFRPQALFGGEIKTYQTEVVPLFLKHLSEYMPVLFLELKEKYPRAKELVTTFSNIGRKALLHTLNSDIVFVDKDSYWTWDGTYLISQNHHTYFLFINKYDEIRLKPSADCVVTITDENQVNDKTEYIS